MLRWEGWEKVDRDEDIIYLIIASGFSHYFPPVTESDAKQI